MDSAAEIMLKLFSVAALVLANGFFVAAEFAIVKVRSTQIEPLARRGNRRARLAQHMIAHLDAYLSATQLGITFTSLGLGWVGEPFVAQWIEPLLRRGNIGSDVVLHSVSFALAFGLITFLHIVFGELAPKSLAIQKAKATTLWVAAPLNLFYVVFKPAIWLLNSAANLVLKMIGLHAATESDRAHSEEELRLLLAGSQEKEVSPLARRLALRAFDLRKSIVRQIMAPRRQIHYLDLKRPMEDNLRLARQSKHTRFPLCDGGLDNVVGLVHIKDLLWAGNPDDSRNDGAGARVDNIPAHPPAHGDGRR
jgi:CBS domain containing-hemolysin-like protein